MGFLDEFRQLRLDTPRIALINPKCVNSDYVNQCYNDKNCYLCFGSDFNEDSMYCKWVNYSRDLVDSSFCENCELCYQCLDCVKCFDSMFLQDCEGSDACFLGYDLKGCRNCFGCVGLRRKENYIFNKSCLGKDEYLERVAVLKEDLDEAHREFTKLRYETPVLYSRMLHCEDSTGDYLLNSKNCRECYDVQEGWDLTYMTQAYRTKDSMDCFCVGDVEQCYECMGLVTSTNLQFCGATCVDCSDLEYCELCYSCHDCFGCVSLQRKRHCILNKQYSREEYFSRVTEIKAQMRVEGLYGRYIESVYDEEDTVLWTS
ncbi:hypothetical protein HOE67_01570 [Candidatus Peregrinibacteria bacterium]|jgi:hypothetical protein|nr:hypothetical protein [Candidatus Peregrinibacteria bacterium]MBT4055776.1 hypothetical protein [Candidatus Peregrinibacteria bacterium]